MIQAEGTPEEKVQSYAVSLTQPETYVVQLEKGRRTQVLPYQAEASPVLTIPAPGAEAARGEARRHTHTGGRRLASACTHSASALIPFGHPALIVAGSLLGCS